MNDEIKDIEVESRVRQAAVSPALGRWTATLLSRVAQRLRERFEERVADLGLRSKQYGVLILLQDGPLTQIEIARSLEVDRTTMVALIDDLVRLELVERAHHPGDRRAYAVTLTPKGNEVLQVATRAVDEVEAECLAPLSPNERAQLRFLLQKII